MAARSVPPMRHTQFWPVVTGVYGYAAMGPPAERPTLKMYRFDHPQQTDTCWICAPDHNAARQVVNDRMRILNLSPNMPVMFVALPQKEIEE